MSAAATENEPFDRALHGVGDGEAVRAKLVDLCRDIDKALHEAGLDCREAISGPILDAVMRGRVFAKALRDGTVMQMRYGSKISRDFLLSPDPTPDHVWEPQTTKLLLRLAGAARNVAVGGAWVGDQAVLIARRIQPAGGTCHAFEPDPETFAFLKRNAAANHLDNLVCNPVGLWSRETSIHLTGSDAYASPREAAGDESRVPAVRLDEYASTRGITRFDLLMLDTEGGEAAALAGAGELLAEPPGEAPNVVFEIHRHYVDWSRGLDETEVVRLLRGHGYDIYAVRDYHSNHPMEGEPVELIPARDVFLEGPPHGFNMLAVKEPSTIHDPFFRIVRGVSPKLLRNRDPALHLPVR